MNKQHGAQSRWTGAGVALLCGSLILLLSLGIRHSFGLFLQPVTVAQGWGRETFAFAMALQNLVWGLSQPFAGMLSDRFGAPRIVAFGALLYSSGLWVMSSVSGEPTFILGAGVLIGLGLSGTTFPIIFGTISRLVAQEHRSLAMGITMAVGSFGQFIMLPISLGFMAWLDWQGALMGLAVLSISILPLAIGMKEAPRPLESSIPTPAVPIKQALREALAMRDFWLLSLGFFVCGFQVVFIGVHLPSYLVDEGLGMSVATTVLALIGLANIAGTYYAGFWGGRLRKPMLLSWIYLARAATIAMFVLLPMSSASAYVFGALMGILWLSTVPLTNGTVASIWGVRHLSMLGGIVFFAHQLGSFTGGWLGGWLYDRHGSYDTSWMIAIGLSVLAAFLNWPIQETSAQVRTSETAQ